ncbi:hypothetical protein F5J12DRAFT_787750 [Pisolithus orientalis]|uniref:uncharacterized protein n=1 Tax=Pisolithus orientalis TaxID=936130 RepID=UPI00222568BF|nr:uncharacterized protein F5J12DRAFT_787750 [Pisolithus orientalis]KAI5983687.1 hypothetical protein F5J12DRAFT_787750 [Pisolithus orientalis]
MTHTFQRGDNIFVNGDDGSLWYAVIKDIRVQRLKRIQKAWVEVQWYYSRSDIGDKNMRKYVGNNELVLSDHNDIIEPEAIVSWKLMESIAPADITSFSAERAPSMLALSVKNHIAQTKLNNETCKGKHQTPGHHKGSPKWDRSLTAGYSERKELEEARVMIRRLNTALVVSDAVVELNKEQRWDHAPSECIVDKSSKLDPSDLDGHNYIGKCGYQSSTEALVHTDWATFALVVSPRFISTRL